MDKKVLSGLILGSLFVGSVTLGLFLFNKDKDSEDFSKRAMGYIPSHFTSVYEYDIDGEKLRIDNKNLKYFGNDLEIDLNNDGMQDYIFLVTKENGGSGTFFYVTGALRVADGYKTTNSVFLGDRIAPQTINLINGEVVVNYADRKSTDPMTEKPSIGVSRYFKFENDSLIEATKNKNITSKPWTWIKAQYNDGKVVEPKSKDAFVLTFNEDKTFNFSTDCNRGFGSYSINESKIELSNMGSTKMYCEGAQEDEFVKMLTDVNSLMFTDKGELVLEIKYDSGSILFK